MPGDPRVERTLSNLAEIIDHPTGWSPSAAHAWQAVAAEAKRVIESLDELGPDSAIEQGVSRLALRSFASGQPGPWNGVTNPNDAPGDGQWVRYRGHVLTRESSDDGWVIAMMYTDHDGQTRRAMFYGGTEHADAADVGFLSQGLRDLDYLLDAVFAVQPLRSDAEVLMVQRQQAGGKLVEVHHFDIENHAESFNEGYETAMAQQLADDPTVAQDWLDAHDCTTTAAAIDRALDVAKQVSDATAQDPVANTAVWDVIDRIQKLRPVDVPTEQDRAEAEADDEREAKAQQRAVEWTTEGLEQTDGE